MKLPKISIVIPSYNKANYIKETLESIIKQKYPNLEIIVQDGGSTDGSLKIIKNFAVKYSDLMKWESKKDKGQMDAINKGMSKASGDIVTYINADDVYTKGSLKIVGKYFAEYPKTPWLAGQGKIINQDSKEMLRLVTAYKNLLLNINNYQLLLIVNYLIQPSVFLSRKAFVNYGPYPGIRKFVTEYDLWLRIGNNQMPAVINKPLSKFRIEPLSVTSTQAQQLLSKDFEIVQKYTKSKIIIYLHKAHNSLRMLIGNMTKK